MMAANHFRQFFDSIDAVHPADDRLRLIPLDVFAHRELQVRIRRDLRQMRDTEHLVMARQIARASCR